MSGYRRKWGSTRRWRVMRQAMINRAIGTQCPLCNTPLLAHQRLSLDHKLARIYGGQDHPANLQVTHARCNLSKGKGQPPVWATYQ